MKLRSSQKMRRRVCSAKWSSPFSRVQPGGLRVEFPFLTSFLTHRPHVICNCTCVSFAYVTIHTVSLEEVYVIACASFVVIITPFHLPDDHNKLLIIGI